MNKVRLYIIVTSVLFAFSCATKVNLNMGETDYRVSVPEESTLLGKYESDDTLEVRRIKKDQSISIHLKQIHIANFSERLEKWLASAWATTVRGEIAVLVRAYEMKNGETLDFRSSAVKSRGRLVYYSEDVRPGGHLLNGSMLPVFGPIKYNGNPVVIEFTVLELDIGEAQQAKGLLSALANLGAKAYPPASPVLKTLDALGEQLLSGEQDDIEMRYIFVLHPQGGHEKTDYAELAVGDYVLMRQGPKVQRIWIDEISKSKGIVQGFNPLPWQHLNYDSTKGRLYCKETTEARKLCNRSDLEFRENTYAVFQINSGFPSIGLDVAQTFEEFQAEAEKAVEYEQFEADVGAILDEMQTEISEEKTASQVRRELRSAVSMIEAMCAEPDNRLHHATALFDVVVKKAGFSTDSTGAKTPPDFSSDQWRSLLQVLRGHSSDPASITQTSVNNVGDVDALIALVKCDRG